MRQIRQQLAAEGKEIPEELMNMTNEEDAELSEMYEIVHSTYYKNLGLGLDI